MILPWHGTGLYCNVSSRSVCRCASHFALWLCECADGGFRFDDLYSPALRAFSRSVFALCKEFRLELACCCQTRSLILETNSFLAEAHLRIPVA